MYFEQLYLESLGHASYVVGSEQTGEALVFDPRRDVDAYFAVARRQGMRVRYALDSHGHNDYLSGLSEIAARADVEVLGSAAATLGYHHRPVRHGERWDMGEVGVEVLHTPGHTPEHLSLLLYDGQTGDETLVSRGRMKMQSKEPGQPAFVLDITRAQTVDACQALGLAPWHDPHNCDPAYARARVRATALPADWRTLRALWPPAVNATVTPAACSRARSRQSRCRPSGRQA